MIKKQIKIINGNTWGDTEEKVNKFLRSINDNDPEILFQMDTSTGMMQYAYTIIYKKLLR